MECEECPGGDDHTHEVNPSFATTNIVVDGTRIIFPRVLRPENICLNKLANVDVDAAATAAICDNLPIVWDPVACCFTRAEWPAPSIIDWDITATTGPPDADCTDCGPGAVYAREVNADCISHICVAGAWVCVGGTTTSAPPGTTLERVCYDVGAWAFPASYGGTQGEWQAYGANRMTEVCSSGTQSYASQGVEFSCWGDGGASDGPTDGWNSLTWDPDTINNNPNVMGATGDPNGSHGCARPAFRLDPGLPVGAAGPIVWDVDLTNTSGNTQWAAYDIVSGAQLPVTIVSQPACGNAELRTGPNGPQVRGINTCVGDYTFSFDLPSGVTAENVRFLMWNVGGSNSGREEIVVQDITAETPAGDCCLEWANISDLATWMNQNDPGNNTWTVVGDSICADLTPGVSVNYSTLGSCDDTAAPAIV